MRYLLTIGIFLLVTSMAFGQCDNWIRNGEYSYKSFAWSSIGDIYKDGTVAEFYYLEDDIVSNGVKKDFDSYPVIYGYTIDINGEIENEITFPVPRYTLPRNHIITDTTVYLVVSFTDSISILNQKFKTNKNGLLLLQYSRELELKSVMPLISSDDITNRMSGMFTVNIVDNELLLACGLKGEMHLGDSLVNIKGNESYEDDLAIQIIGYDLTKGKITRVTEAMYDDSPRIAGLSKNQNDELILVMGVNNTFTYKGKEVEGLSSLGYEYEQDILILNYKNDSLANYYHLGSEGGDGVQSVKQIGEQTYLSGFFGSGELKTKDKVLYNSSSSYNSFLASYSNNSLKLIKNFSTELNEDLEGVDPYTSIGIVAEDTLLLSINYNDKLITGQDVFVSKSESKERYRKNSVIFTFAKDQLIEYYRINSTMNVSASASARINGQYIVGIGWQQDFSTNEFSESNSSDRNQTYFKICQEQFKPLGVDELERQFSMYPNPTNGLLKIEGLAYKQVVIYNTMGQKVTQFTNNESIDLSSYQNGIYLGLVYLTDGTTAQKVIVKE